MAIIIKEKLDTRDFLEANFPHVLEPVYKRRYFLINIAFAVVFVLLSLYLYYISNKNNLKFEAANYAYLFFALLFVFLGFYLIRRERKIYEKVVRQINDLQTIYHIGEKEIKVDNKAVNLRYKTSDIKQIKNLPKWFVIEFDNDERISLYKPNMTNEQIEKFMQMFEIKD